MRVICLHDKDSSSKDFQKSLRELCNKLLSRHSIELIFIDSPIVVSGNRLTRLWFREENIKLRSIKTNQIGDYDVSIVGINASLLHISQLWTHIMPEGILGVGQGAVMASIMCQQCSGNESIDAINSFKKFPGLRFGIFLHGYPLRNNPFFSSNILGDITENELQFDMVIDSALVYKFGNKKIETKTLHAFHENDTRGRDLFHHFYDKKVPQKSQHYIMKKLLNLRENSSHNFSIEKLTRDRQLHNAIGKFLVTQKKELKHLIINMKINNTHFPLNTYSSSLPIMALHPILETIEKECDRKETQKLENLEEPKQCCSYYDYDREENVKNISIANEMPDSVYIQETKKIKLQKILQDIKNKSAQLEQRTWKLLNANIVLNPPKALVSAVVPRGLKYYNTINPTYKPSTTTKSFSKNNHNTTHNHKQYCKSSTNDRVIGCWIGNKDEFRSEDFKKAGGAPYPVRV